MLLVPSPIACYFPTSSSRPRFHPLLTEDGAANAVRAKSIGFLASRLQARANRARSPLSPLRLTSASPVGSLATSTIPLTPVIASLARTPLVIGVKRSFPGSPTVIDDTTATSERQRRKVPKVHLPLEQEEQGGERQSCTGIKEFGSSVHNKATLRGQAQLHRLRIIKGMSTSTAPGRVRPRLSLSLDTASTSASTHQSSPTTIVSPYPDTMATAAASPVVFDNSLRSFAAAPSRFRSSPPAIHPAPTSNIDDTPSFLPQPMSLKRPNPKRLSLSLTIPPTPAIATTATNFSTPAASDTASTATEYTPYTPGPPMTPGIAMSLGRAATKPGRRPNLMSLITQPPTNSDVPPTPGGYGVSPFAAGSARVTNPYATMRDARRRSNTAEETSSAPFFPPHPSSRSAHPRIGSCDTISESDSSSANSSAYHSRQHSTTTAATSTSQQSTPYADGPVELVPGVYLGAEESVYEHHTWASTSRVRILNVAQEVDDPWGAQQTDRKGKGKVFGAFYPADEGEKRPEVEYKHLLWGHGESGLAEVDEAMVMSAIIAPDERKADEGVMKESWRFWEAIQWIEEGRRKGEHVLIQ